MPGADGDGGLHHEKRRLALACADLGFFEIDGDARVVTMDARARELLGLPADGPIALDAYLGRLDPDDRDRVDQHAAAAIATGRDVYHDEFRTVGRRWISADGRAFTDSGQRNAVLVGVLCDVTLRRTTEDARARLVDEMARSLRFNDMLIGMVANDLRSPLSAVLATADAAGVPRIVESAGRMSRIVTQLLELTHGRLDGQIPLKVVTTDLATIVRDVSAEVMAAHPGAAIGIEAQGDAGCVCDHDRIAEVLSNLAGNAAQHGTVATAVRVFVDGTHPDTVSVTVRNPGAIPADVAPMVFNPFRRSRGDRSARDRSHGLGLGLYIARRIVIGHGGEISMSTSERDGTAFRIELPRTTTSASFSLTPDQGDEEAVSLERLGISDQPSRVTASLFGVLPLQARAPDAFTSLADKHRRLLELSLDRQVYRDAGASLASDLRGLAEQLGTMGAGAQDVAALHSHALQQALRGAPALKAQTLVTEGRLLALELMGRLLTFYRKRSGFGAAPRAEAQGPERP
jgi:signal transduction histidine kinase